MPTPKVVVFDLGKVLLDFDYTIAAQKLAAQSEVTADAIKAFIDASPLLVDYEKGLVSRDVFFQTVRDQSGYRGSAAEFYALFADIFTPIQEMVDWQQRLRAAGWRTYIFSNTNDLAIEHIRARFPFFNHFDGYVLSYEHGFMKPEPQLYERVETMTGCRNAQILYFDDRTENVEAGRARGWQAVHHVSPQQSLTAAQQAGVPV